MLLSYAARKLLHILRGVLTQAPRAAEGNGAVMSFTVGIAYHFFDRQALDSTAVLPLNR